MTVRAKKELGQHFLVDENILGVIGRLAALRDEDVVLEIGPGLGVLTTYLADRVAQVYAIELDTSLGPRLVERLAGRPNVELRFGDALRLDLGEVAPGATKLVSNLPYNIATPLLVESLDRLPGVGVWCVMVQREVADRLFARPSTKAYGAVSVLVPVSAASSTAVVLETAARVVAVGVPVAVGLVAWRRAPFERFGRLLVVTTPSGVTEMMPEPTLSSTVRHGRRVGSWNTMPTSVTGSGSLLPPTWISPSLGSDSPAAISINARGSSSRRASATNGPASRRTASASPGPARSACAQPECACG